jgi:hypothetical protein
MTDNPKTVSGGRAGYAEGDRPSEVVMRTVFGVIVVGARSAAL